MRSRIEGGRFPTCASRLGAERILFKLLQEFHGLTAGGFQRAFLALAPRTFVEQRLQALHGLRA
eukprot:2991521-Pyramimonas_sp.AAC.1